MLVRDILSGSKWCASCAVRVRMMKLPEEERKRMATHASRSAVGKTKAAQLRAERVAKYGDAWGRVYNTMAGAKRRCTRENDIGWMNYGGRGIQFVFPSVELATLWVLDNLGAPDAVQSIDRIDNNRHYEPGNLRWATRTEQARNKRQYKVSATGARLRSLRKLRPDLTYETIRAWVKKGFSDDEIIGRKKHIGCGVRREELRTEAQVCSERENSA